MDRHVEPTSSAHIARQDEATSARAEDAALNMFIQNFGTFTPIAEIERLAELVSDYVITKYEDFVQTGRVRSIEEAVQKQQWVLNITNQDAKNYGEELDLLGVLLEVRYEQFGNMPDLQEAIDKAAEAVRVTPANHRNLAAYLTNLSTKLQRRYERTGSVADLETAIKKSEEAVRVTPTDHPSLAVYLNGLGTNLLKRYERTGNIADLELAINTAEKAVRVTPPDHPALAGRLNNLSNNLNARYERTGNMADLELAINTAEKAVRVTPPDHPALAGRLNNLSNHLDARYERTGNMADLEMAIDKAEEAVQVTPPEHPILASLLNNLGNKLQGQYERTGNVADLEMAINKAEEAVRVTPLDHPNLATWLDGLGNKLASRYERTGNVVDLEAAIEKAEEAVRITPPDHPDLAARLNNLGSKLESRFTRTGHMADLEMAISKGEEAVQLKPVDHPKLAGYLSNTGNKLQWRYERTGNMTDLEAAINKAEEAMRVTPPDHPALAARLNNLSSKLASRYERMGNVADLEMAINKAEEAVRVTPPDHPDLAIWLDSLGNWLINRYERTGNVVDLEAAIEKAEEAVRITPPEQPDLAGTLYNLGRRQLLNPHPPSATSALTSFLSSWNCHVGVPSPRLRSAGAAIDILIGRKCWNEAADLSVEAINLLPLMNRRTLSLDDQQHILAMFTGLAAKACSLSIQCGRPVERSIEILEQGRGAIMGLLIDDRSDISLLRESYSEHAAEYDRLRTEVNRETSDYKPGAVGEQMRKRRTKAVQELEECIENIRNLPGCERFLASASAQELQQQSAAGPIIVVNVTDIRSDAIIVTPTRVQLLPLPAFAAEVLRSWKRQRLTEFGRSEFGKKNKKYRAFLSWLWVACVQPVAARLRPCDRTCGAPQPLLRSWWIGTGEASAVPFHAAGDHRPGSTDNTFSRRGCSYTPTIKALKFSRERIDQCRRIVATGEGVDGAPSLCVATMPRTPGMAPLRGVEDELSRIVTAAASTFTVTHLPSPRAMDVKTQLNTCSVFHFAGHGMANAVDPSRGSLVLHTCVGPNAEPQQDFLSVNDIARLRVRHAQLAYLSACSTAENQATQLADEVIHLVSGFQAVGFPHVVGSMWQSADEICADMAQLFYQRICALDEGLLKEGSVARALHAATLEIRKRCSEEPLLWAQYAHFGA